MSCSQTQFIFLSTIRPSMLRELHFIVVLCALIALGRISSTFLRTWKLCMECYRPTDNQAYGLPYIPLTILYGFPYTNYIWNIDVGHACGLPQFYPKMYVCSRPRLQCLPLVSVSIVPRHWSMAGRRIISFRQRRCTIDNHNADIGYT